MSISYTGSSGQTIAPPTSTALLVTCFYTKKRHGRHPHTCFKLYLVVVDDHALQLHAQSQDGGEVLNAVERDLRDVQQPRHTADLHECSVGLDSLDVAVAEQGGSDKPTCACDICQQKK